MEWVQLYMEGNGMGFAGQRSGVCCTRAAPAQKSDCVQETGEQKSSQSEVAQLHPQQLKAMGSSGMKQRNALSR